MAIDGCDSFRITFFREVKKNPFPFPFHFCLPLLFVIDAIYTGTNKIAFPGLPDGKLNISGIEGKVRIVKYSE